MLAKKYRLTRRQINLIYKKGRGKRFDEIGVKFLPNNLEFSRFSVIIPKAVINKVTERNRLRRLIFAELSEEKPAKDVDVIIRLFKAVEESRIRQRIVNIIKSINV